MSTAWVNILVRNGADVNRLTPNNKTALHFACENNNVSVTALLLKLKANVKISDKEGNTPLSIALNSDNKELVNLLLSKTREFNFKTKHLKTPRSIDFSRKQSNSKKRLSKNKELDLLNASKVSTTNS